MRKKEKREDLWEISPGILSSNPTLGTTQLLLERDFRFSLWYPLLKLFRSLAIILGCVYSSDCEVRT